MKAYMRVEGRGTLNPGVEYLPLPQVNSNCVHSDEIWEIVSSILLKGIQKLQMIQAFLNPFYHYIKIKAYTRVKGKWGGVGDTLARGRVSCSTTGKFWLCS